MKRYQRHIQLAEIGAKGQEKLQNAQVLVVGAGGLGCPALQYLVAAGIGKVSIVDGDQVSISNLQRQVLFAEKDLGKNKALTAKARLSQLNSEVEIQAYPEHLTLDNAEKLIYECDLVLDCTDNFVTRYLINDACIRKNKPFIHGSLYKYEGQLSAFNYQGGPSYRCLFPEPPKKGDVPNCNEVGVLGVLPGIIGTMQATEAIKMITGLGEILSGKVLYINLLDYSQRKFEFNRNSEEVGRIRNQKQINLVDTDDCDLDSSVNLSDLDLSEKLIWIDVREKDELPRLELSGLLEIPLSDWKTSKSQIPKEGKKVFFCASGIRSKRALAEAKKENIPHCFSLEEGADELKEWIKK